MHARTPPEESTPTKPIKPLAAATVTTAALVLAGCGAGGTTAAPTVTETVTEDRGPASASQTTAPGDDGAGDRTTNTSPATGDDPVIAAIDCECEPGGDGITPSVTGGAGGDGYQGCALEISEVRGWL